MEFYKKPAKATAEDMYCKSYQLSPLEDNSAGREFVESVAEKDVYAGQVVPTSARWIKDYYTGSGISTYIICGIKLRRYLELISPIDLPIIKS